MTLPQILSLGISGRNLADAVQAWQPLELDPNTTADAARNAGNGAAANICEEPHPNAIIRLQRVRDIPIGRRPAASTPNPSLATSPVPACAGVSQNEHDYWPNALYDTREGNFRDGHGG